MIPKCMLNEACEYGNYIMGLTSEYSLVVLKDSEDVTTELNQSYLKRGYNNFWVSCHSCVVNTANADEILFPKIPTFTTDKIGKTKNTVSIHLAISTGNTFTLNTATADYYPSNFCSVPGFILTATEDYLTP